VAEAVGTRIAVTGAGGFVGGALVRALGRRAGVKVFPLSRPAFELRDPHTFDVIPRDIDVVVHAAGVLGDVHDAHALWQVNVVATQALVEHVSAHRRPPYLLFLSTGGVNGATDGVTADACEPRPEGLYALTKYLAEEVVRRTYKGQWGIARLYFPYGPGQAHERLIPRLVARIVAGEPITLNREGRPAISPIYIDDLVGILARLIDKRETGIRMVAGNEAVTIDKLAAELAILLGKTPRFVETQTWALDYCAAALPGVAYTPIRDGLRATLHHLRV
jgi:UDP-glucose 4-epimerase